MIWIDFASHPATFVQTTVQTMSWVIGGLASLPCQLGSDPHVS